MLTLDLFTVNLVELVFETLANYAVAFEDNKTEWLVLPGFLVDWSGKILDITEGAKVFSKSFISGFGLDTADKHFTIASFGFFGVDLFTIDFVTTRGKDGIDRGLVGEDDETEATGGTSVGVNLYNGIFDLAK